MDELVELLEEGRDLSRTALHVDMDAFYAAVEMRDDPALRTIPMAVGSDAMLSTSNYTARRYGVRSAMPGFIAKKLCPELKIIPCDFDRYRAASHEVRKIFAEYDSNFQMGSLDEAYLDVSEYVLTRLEPVERARIRYSGDCICRLPLLREDEKEKLQEVSSTEEVCRKCGKVRICVHDVVRFGCDVDEIVREMRFRVEQTTGLTCSAGIAPNSMIAKICSDINKPNGQFRVANDKVAVLEFMRNLPIRKVSGIGAVTEAILKGIGVEKCGDLYEKRAIISLLFTRCSYEHFLRIALGISTSYTAFVSPEKESRRKSISVERTFHPTGDMKLLLEIAEDLCAELIESLSKRGIRGGYSATVKMKFSTFDVITRCTSVEYVINEANRLMALCERIIRNELRGGNKQLRLLGVRLSRLLFTDDKTGSMKSLTSFFATNKTDAMSDGEMDEEEMAMVEGEVSNNEIASVCDSITSTSHSPHSSRDQSIDPIVQRCPICETVLPNELAAVNRHIDECLNREAIAEVQNETKEVNDRRTVPRKRCSKRSGKSRSKAKPPLADVRKKVSIRDYFVTDER
ncbi:DNA polymerase kappa [Toxocara canis]|uniref:DNA polymerase kappa n=1 Tax=Toxocara canis TaxID=6265 RepID=A0A0B2UQQ1_TOXCA|nr:DNA polymerase kappa [Toxocara canis]